MHRTVHLCLVSLFTHANNTSSRLVEFTKIFIPVRSKTPWCEDFGEMTEDTYMMGVFLGFDRYRYVTISLSFLKH